MTPILLFSCAFAAFLAAWYVLWNDPPAPAPPPEPRCYISLHSADPAKGAGTEVTYSGYARVAMTRPKPGQLLFPQQVVFPVNQGGTAHISHAVLHDPNGKVLATAPLFCPVQLPAASTPRLMVNENLWLP